MAGVQRGLKRAPSPQSALQNSRVNISGVSESIWQPLYDYQTAASAGASTQRFFLVPQGQGGKTLSDTNMELAGQLPKGQAFLITGIQVELYPGVSINGTDASAFADDVYNFYNGGHLILTIGSKAFVTQGPFMKFPPINRLGMDSSTTVATDRYAYATATGREYVIENTLLESSQNFNVELSNLSALSADARVGVTLNGYLYRNAQ